MARKKRGGKNAAAARKAKAQKQVQNVISEETAVQSPTQTESEESCGSGTPKSCNTPVEIEKTASTASSAPAPNQHKKFGKFRCLLIDESNKTELSSSESEMQIDPLELQDSNVEIITIDPDNLIDDLKSVEITESETIETIEDISICAEEIVQEEIIEEVSENIVEINTLCDVQMEAENSNEVPLTESEPEIKTDFVDSLQTSDESQEQSIVPESNNDSNSNDAVSNPPEEETEAKSQESLNENKSPNDTEPNSDNSTNTETTTVRRSSRIKSISVLKQRSKGRGLVKSEKKDKVYKPMKNISSDLEVISENSNSNTASSEKNLSAVDSPSFATPAIGTDNEQKPVKVKSRWRRSSELEMGGSSPLSVVSQCQSSPQVSSESENQNSSQTQSTKEDSPVYDEEMENRLRQFQHLQENQYLTERTVCKEAKKMVCDCFLTKEEIERGEFGCGEDCLNRLLMIECGSQCTVGDRCTNKRFQKLQYASCEVFKTEKKGYGIKATADIPYGEFIMEYVGEVLDPDEFDDRAKEYSKIKNLHYYFMALRSDSIIDATLKGNISRFINHSCDPNAETQKWTVNGELRIGFFSKRTIIANEEITFDYQFQRYGKEAQKCYCEASNCRGWIGEEPDDEEDEEESEPEEEVEDVKSESDSPEKKEPKPKSPKQIKKKRQYKKQRKDIFDDLDLDEEIEVLSATGLKNQAHTLKLSRLMVRAKEFVPRMQLLKILRDGDVPCRRLFLDYHGLRLMHGWMCDAASMIDEQNKTLSFKIEMLRTLESLPIPNKTTLQDSKVLSTVEKWFSGSKTEVTSPVDDSASNSPQIDSVAEPVKKEKSAETETTKETEVSKPEKTEPKEPEPMEVVEEKKDTKQEDFTLDIDIDTTKLEEASVKSPENKESVEDVKQEVIENKVIEIKEEVPEKTEEKMEDTKMEETTTDSATKTEEKENENGEEKLIAELTAKLLSNWSELKEIFRIPKKERIEQMKEHEREADRGYKAGLGLEQENRDKITTRYYKGDRYRIIEKRKSKETIEHDRNLANKKGLRLDDRNIINMPKLSKHERRQLFALQVAQEEEGRRRKQEQEMWRLHEQRCMVMGADPRLTNMDMNQYQCFWNPNTAQWQPAFPPQPTPPNQQMPLFDPNCGLPPTRPPLLQTPPQHLPPPLMIPPMGGNPMNQNRPPLLSQPLAQPLPQPMPQQMPQQMPQPMPQPYQPPPTIGKEEVAFAGPIPPPVKLPPKWKCARDKYGRPYYYHVKARLSQWEPPEFPPPIDETATDLVEESSSSSETSSLSSDSSTDSDEDSEIGDTKLLLEIRNKLKHIEAKKPAKVETITSPLISEIKTESPEIDIPEDIIPMEITPKRKREGLVQEIIISPRREEDKIASKIEMKKYKETKEKLRRQKQMILEQTKKKLKNKLSKASGSKSSKKHKSSKSSKLKNIGSIDMNSEEARKIKEHFRSSMASVMVQNLNAYRKPDCKLGRITNTEDFKHLARKLTHFVMLKELKHCQSIEELTCNDSVKTKARDFVKKYMAKFGEVYARPKDEID